MDIVPFVDLAAHHAPLGDRIQDAVSKVLVHGKYILGPEVDTFEQGFAAMADFSRGVTAVRSRKQGASRAH